MIDAAGRFIGTLMLRGVAAKQFCFEEVDVSHLLHQRDGDRMLVREPSRMRPSTLEEAVDVLRNVRYGPQRRFCALRNGFEAREVPEYGLGMFAVEVATGKVCEFKGLWVDGGKILLCQNCFEDGT